MSQRQILVTAALPYANGPIHLGHLVEYVQTDIWVRFQKLRGHRCIYICADDTHGTAIMKSARQRGCSEEEFVTAMHESHQHDFAGFDVQFDNYGSTHSPENRELCHVIWKALETKDLVSRRKVVELFDAQTGESLPDRFVRGKCPNCAAPDQFGDNCDNCGHTYTATELIDPISTVSGQTPVQGEQDHFFVNIEALHGFLDEWTQCGEHLQKEVANYLKGHFLHQPLRDWDVSRPAPISDSTFPARTASTTGTFGSTPRSGTWLRQNNGVTSMARRSTIGGALPARKYTTSLARTSSTFTVCFGPRC